MTETPPSFGRSRRPLMQSLIIGIALYGLRFVRRQFYLGRLGYRLEFGRSLACYLEAFAFTTTPGKVGETVRSVQLKRDGVRHMDSLAALSTERPRDS